MSSPIRLRVEGGPHLGQTFVVERSGVTIGRQDGNDIVLDDARLSRQHVRLDLRAGGLVVTDLGSANGTRVNGQPVRQAILHAGDRLEFGSLQLEFAPYQIGQP